MSGRLKDRCRLTHAFICDEFSSQLWMSAIAFPVLMIAGFALGYFNKDLAETMVLTFSQQLADKGVIDNDGSIQLIQLLLNNLQAAIFTVCYGLIPFLYLPALSLGINGMLMGFFAAFYVNNGMSMLFFAAAIIPHGIFEIPALIYSLAMGLYLCRTITDYVRNNTKGIVKEAAGNLLWVFLLRAVPLFTIASLVETFVTPWIVTFL